MASLVISDTGELMASISDAVPLHIATSAVSSE